MKKKLLVVGLVSVLILAGGCSKIAKLENGEEVVAKIDGLTVTANDLYKAIKGKYGTSVLVNMIDSFIANKEYKTTDDIKKYAESQLESLKIQYEYAGQDFNTALLNAGYRNEQEFKDEIILQYKKDEVAKKLIKDNLKEDEINKYYEEEIFGQINAKHILIKPVTTSSMTDAEKKKAEEEALKEAGEVIKKFNNKEMTWKELVNKYTDDTSSKETEGLIAEFTKEDVSKYGDDFWNSVYSLENDKIAEKPVKSSYGFHVILKVSAKEKPTLKDVLEDVKNSLVEKKTTDDTSALSKAWVDVRKKYNLSIDDTDVKGFYDQITANY